MYIFTKIDVFYTEKLVFNYVAMRCFFYEESEFKKTQHGFKSPISSLEWYFLHSTFFCNDYRKTNNYSNVAYHIL